MDTTGAARSLTVVPWRGLRSAEGPALTDLLEPWLRQLNMTPLWWLAAKRKHPERSGWKVCHI